MTISGVFLSVLSGAKSNAATAAPPSAEQVALRRYEIYRRSFPMTEIAFPACTLRNYFVAKWVRDRRLAVDVRTGADLEVAIAAGVHPARLTAHADTMGLSELRATAHLGLARITVSTMAQIDFLAGAVGHRMQEVVVRVTSGNSAQLTDAVLAEKRFNLVGLHCDVGPQEDEFLSYPAAVGDMITELAMIRRSHGAVLTRLGLGGGRAVPSGDWTIELPGIATQIDESLDDACATLRFPRPLVVLSPGVAIVDRNVA